MCVRTRADTDHGDLDLLSYYPLDLSSSVALASPALSVSLRIKISTRSVTVCIPKKGYEYVYEM